MFKPKVSIPFVIKEDENYLVFNNGEFVEGEVDGSVNISINHDNLTAHIKTTLHINKSCSLKLIKANNKNYNTLITVHITEGIEVNLIDLCMDSMESTNVTLNIYCDNNSNVKYTSIQETNNKFNYNVNFYVKENVNLEINTLNLNNNEVNNCINVYMNEMYSHLNVNNSLINNTGLKQSYDYNIYHNNKDTESKLINYAICKNESVLNINSNGIIKRRCARSKIHQKSKGIILDLKSAISANPLLQIDEFDVEANHGASIGAIDDEDLYYLMSRGLTKSQSEQLIVSGYMEPIIKNITDEEIKNLAINLITEKLK